MRTKQLRNCKLLSVLICSESTISKRPSNQTRIGKWNAHTDESSEDELMKSNEDETKKFKMMKSNDRRCVYLYI